MPVDDSLRIRTEIQRAAVRQKLGHNNGTPHPVRTDGNRLPPMPAGGPLEMPTDREFHTPAGKAEPNVRAGFMLS